ncbi:MAG: hypothetical protein GTO03_03480 [Planctomycetales bacterium]|nr:hypothetical protein [Planctomycetales bacterium]
MATGQGQLDEMARQQLADQLRQIEEKLEAIAGAHQQASDDLQRQIQQARRDGDQAAAEKLQEAWDQLQQQLPALEQLAPLAQKCADAAQAMQEGQADRAGQALDQLAAELAQLQNELEEMQAWEATLGEIELAKNALTCSECAGGGCRQCQGAGRQSRAGAGGVGAGGQGGDGLGAATGGRGTRPETEDDASTYDSQVRGQVGPGRAVAAGRAEGPNAKGPVRDAIQADFHSQDSGPADPLSTQRLPKSHQRLVEEYFEAIRTGE